MSLALVPDLSPEELVKHLHSWHCSRLTDSGSGECWGPLRAAEAQEFEFLQVLQAFLTPRQVVKTLSVNLLARAKGQSRKICQILFFFVIVVLEVHFDIYKSSYTMS
jgi:hypothetical protein